MRSSSLLLILGAIAGAFVLYRVVGRDATGVERIGSSEPVSPGGARTAGAEVPSRDALPAIVAPTRSDAPGVRSPDAPGGGAAPRPLEAPFKGRVVDTRGRPVADASVYLAQGDRSAGIPLENLDPAELPWARRAESITDGLGRFEVAPLSTGALRLAVRARGFAPHERAVSTLDLVRDLGDVVLEDGIVLSGRVLDTSRRPVAGASIRRLDADARPAVILGTSIGDVVATTGDDGAFRVDELPSGRWLLLIRSDEHPDKLERGDAAGPGRGVSGLEIVLDDGAEIRGRVSKAPAEALSALWVRAVPKRDGDDGGALSGERYDETRFLLLPRGARCAPDGSFTVRGLARGVTYRLAARAGEHDFFGRARTPAVEARAGEDGVELVYEPARALVFQAVDASTTEPVTELEVRAGSRELRPLAGDGGNVRRQFPAGRVRIDYDFDAHAGESLELSIEARGYEPMRVAGLRPVEGRDIDLGVLRLERCPTLAVRVLDDATGQPVADADVRLVSGESVDAPALGATSSRSSGPPEPAFRSARTDGAGRARLNGTPGERARLVVRHPEFAAFRGEAASAPEPGEHEETVRLLAGGSVVVEVRDALGAAVRGIRIRHVGARGELDAPDASRPAGFTTDAGGALAFAHLEAGVHAFEIDDGRVERSEADPAVAGISSAPPDDLADPAARARVPVSEGSRRTVTLIVPARGRLSGRVTEAGQPVSGATLRLSRRVSEERPRDGGVHDARTNGKGEYAFHGVELGDYDLTVAHPMRSMAFESRAEILDVESKLDVELPSTAIEGRLADENGNPLAGVRVRVERARVDAGARRGRPEPTRASEGSPAVDPDAGSVVARVFSAADGTYRLRGVAAGVDVVVEARGGDYEPARSQVLRVAPGEIRSGIDLRLMRGAALEVKVERSDGRTVPWCRVRAVRDGGPDGSASAVVAMTGVDGTALLRGLESGTWRIAANPHAGSSGGEESTTAEQTVEVVRGATKVARIVLR